MSQHFEKCRDILSDALLNLCRDNEKYFVATETFLFRNFYAQVNLCCGIQKYCRDNVFFSSNFIGHLQLCRNRKK